MPIFHALDDTALLALEVHAWREAARCALEFQRRHDRSIHVILRDALNSANDFWQQVPGRPDRARPHPDADRRMSLLGLIPCRCDSDPVRRHVIRPARSIGTGPLDAAEEAAA
jgi:hypothetical protein